MKIMTVSSYQKNYCSSVFNKKQSTESGGPVFKGWNVNILNASEEELSTIAKSFYNSTDAELREAAKVTTLGIKRNDKSLAAYYKLKCAVDKAKAEVEGIMALIKTAQEKPNKTSADITGLTMLNKQLEEYKTAASKRNLLYYKDTSSSMNDYTIDDAKNLAECDGSWYDY